MGAVHRQSFNGRDDSSPDVRHPRPTRPHGLAIHQHGAGPALADTATVFRTGQAKLIVEYVDPDDPEAARLVARFTAFSFTVTNMEVTLTDLRKHPIEWLGMAERQPWGGLLSHFKDPDGNILTLVEYPRCGNRATVATSEIIRAASRIRDRSLMCVGLAVSHIPRQLQTLLATLRDALRDRPRNDLGFIAREPLEGRRP